MNKRQFYKLLAEKYDLPLEYIRFKVNPIYIWNGNKKLSMDELNAIENAIRWDYVKEDFERDRHRKESIFYGMWEQEEINMRYSVDIERSVNSLAYCLNKVNNGVNNIDEWTVTINAGGIDYGIYFNFDIDNKILKISNQSTYNEEMYLDDIIDVINERYDEE